MGPLQIQSPYQFDALKVFGKVYIDYVDPIDNEIYVTRDQCNNFEYSKSIAILYARRYMKTALDETLIPLQEAEKIARNHNGGPYGFRKDATVPFWEKVLERIVEKKQIVELRENL